MWWGCHVLPVARSAHTGTVSSTTTSPRKMADSVRSDATSASARAWRSSQPTSATMIPIA